MDRAASMTRKKNSSARLGLEVGSGRSRSGWEPRFMVPSRETDGQHHSLRGRGLIYIASYNLCYKYTISRSVQVVRLYNL